MSKIGKKPITILTGVEARIADGNLEFRGQKGALAVKILPFIKAEIKDGVLSFSPQLNSRQARANWGTMRSLANNAVRGVNDGFEKDLDIEGVGYRANLEGDALVLHLGFSHPVRVNPPEGIKISVAKNAIKISGINKDLVGRTAAYIKSLKPVEPYKGKGVRYSGEVVRRKAGKKVAGTTK